MQTDVLIVGQGISGTMLSWWLQKEGKSFLVIDNGAENSSSRIAAGIINPVTGRRYAISWLAETLLEFAQSTYKEFSLHLQAVLFYQRNIIDFYPTPQMRNTFLERITENDSFLHTYPDQNRFNDYFNFDFGCGEIGPAFTVNLSLLLKLWRQKLCEAELLLQEEFVSAELVVKDDNIQYRNITAQKIIFCDGIAAASNPWFERLPFAANKGEALIIECLGLPTDHVFKRGLLLAPTQYPERFWVGSNYQWDFVDDKPSETFYNKTKALLDGWMKLPYTIVQHLAGVRPATVERRPFVGFHPVHTPVGILNGMGTKGTSLAPFFAHQLVQNIVHGLPIMAEADVRRFSRILSK
ncbi:MAG TPA: FAD-binding oxidoreductase [Flavisolibacter sp.]|jgi:glycine/D-amino acid oxidase-like deaminating enzyme|nr:FAD-binding oxidoreductase [Flavisolibacter sp.]